MKNREKQQMQPRSGLIKHRAWWRRGMAVLFIVQLLLGYAVPPVVLLAQQQSDGEAPVSLVQPAEAPSDDGQSLPEATEQLVDGSVDGEEVLPPIEAGHFRIHFQGLPEDRLPHLGLWVWGGVAKESTGWPHGAISLAQAPKTRYGHYIDVPQSATPGTIHYLIVDKTGTTDETIKVTPKDQTISLLTAEMNEAWVDREYRVHLYEPLADDHQIRINYVREDGQYDQWGVWTWNDVQTPSDSTRWPVAATVMQKGRYGAFATIELSRGVQSSIGFLLVHTGTEEKTADLAFANRQQHSQLFVRPNDPIVYTNPYFIAERHDDAPTHPGEGGITVQAQVDGPIQADGHALLSVTISDPQQIGIKQITADATQLGLRHPLHISPELNRIALSVAHSVAPGTYQLPITVVDRHNGSYQTEAAVTVTASERTADTVDWDEQIIYFMVTDRFYDGDATNNNPYGLPYEAADNPRGVPIGGDFKGVMDKLDYLADLGVTTIWITPIVENVGYDVSHGTKNGAYYGYHGYWAADFEKLNPHLGTLEELHQLIDKAHDKNIRIMVDVVLNHAGYGMNATTDQAIPGFPTAEQRAKIQPLLRTQDGLDADKERALQGLPDFRTEDPVVRQQLVQWQADWVSKTTTPNGNRIDAYRVDTVKHVDNTTWQHFKNELVARDRTFHLIGESWGASYQDTKGHLGNGMMDSLLDFGFKDIAKQMVDGQLHAAAQKLHERNEQLTSAETLGQFLSSHDEDGFLYSIGGDRGKQKVAATLLLTAKGQPVIYYGEELGQTGANNWPQYDNRYDLNWTETATSDMAQHYRKVAAFRRAHSEVLSRGASETVAGSDAAQWLVIKRAYRGAETFIGHNIAEQARTVTIHVSDEQAVVHDAYREVTMTPTVDENGQWTVQATIPARQDGGTALWTVAQGSVTRITDSAATAPEPIAEGMLRLHFRRLPEGPRSNLGLWLWDDVAEPSQDNGGWPHGATNLGSAKQDAYGYYVDIKLSDKKREKIGFLINNTAGQNMTENLAVTLLSPLMNEAWVDEQYRVFAYEPLAQAQTLRINYTRQDQQYANLGVWLWNDVIKEETTWPNGVDLVAQGAYGRYVDVTLKPQATSVGFLIVNEKTERKTREGDYVFADLAEHTQVFVRDDDPKIYTNPFFVDQVMLQSAEQTRQDQITVLFSTLDGETVASLRDKLHVMDAQKQPLMLREVTLSGHQVVLTGDFDAATAPLTVTYQGKTVPVRIGWQLKDAQYGYDGPLGAQLADDGTHATVTLWSPSADEVSVVVYDKNDSNREVARVAMTRGEKGTWHAEVTAAHTNSEPVTGYYYQYEIKRGDQSVRVLDPYAKSMAPWNQETAQVAEGMASKPVGKGAFVNPSKLGPALEYAHIPNYTKREDAIIYEAHVRDFTSDPTLDGTLQARFGTFAAFSEKLDYLKELGVTHIQLLPVMSYYFGDELASGTRLTEYASRDTNYNWGYDPHSYFSLSGMYASNPHDASSRIAEFKQLIHEIHKRDMGVILDVVYNHTAQTHIFEDLEPQYYHFMNADGTVRESFGGGRLGTTHKMARRVLVDSITYWTQEFKVDGFRFDMMGDHDAASIQAAYDAASQLNPNILMLGEGWRTFTGDEHQKVPAADQDWMQHTNGVAVFSDDIRNELKSGFGSEGQARFLTGGPRNIRTIFHNIIGKPSNFTADDPGDVIQYIAAHDNLTLYDVIAQSIKKDPQTNDLEIHKRIRLGNSLILTAQGTPFLHSGQEYGRTKQFLHPDFATQVTDDRVPYKSTYLTQEDGTPFAYPYFIHDSYDSSDAVNRFDWAKATDASRYPNSTTTQAYTRGLIQIRRESDAFRRDTFAEIDAHVALIGDPNQTDVLIAYQATASNGDRYAVFVNADTNSRTVPFDTTWGHLANGSVIADGQSAGTQAIANPVGVVLNETGITLDPLTPAIIRVRAQKQSEEPQPPMFRWQQIGSDWIYVDRSGTRQTGWHLVGDRWFYMNSDGVMLRGWQEISNRWYYLHEGGQMATGWLQLNGVWYYLHEGGQMATGWLQLNGVWYYLHEGGSMAKGWLQLNGVWYYLHDGGQMATGWLQLNGVWYYLHEGGSMAKGWLQRNGKWYYLRDNGAMVTGIQRINNTTYRFDVTGAWLP